MIPNKEGWNYIALKTITSIFNKNNIKTPERFLLF